ncbi:discoidin domain-containing protein [Stigmatella sp. ncwal1]|uniref:Discoidin domain-containing protein n=1 Tax=Stigmatella ashevillensis TaxID=2995309 RepID=A0ABT5DKT7_9BACT|nr:discoidin domain-containing protein [Stigmatella ashevillena]MDC0713634.1 discoidin domain-containing protein [Stigmatella ashevillena]
MRLLLAVGLLPLFSACSGPENGPEETAVSAQAVAPPTSERVTIDLSAGMPGQNHWRYLKGQDSTAFAAQSFDDSAWSQVGIPHGANYLTTFLNTVSGGGDGYLDGGSQWYRLRFTLGTQYAASKVLVEFEGAHTGVQVYINGTLLPGISAVAGNAQASHVVGFLPFIVDLTPYLQADGATQNVLAVRVSRGAAWFKQPGFSGAFRFGQAEAGLFRPAKMFITNKVHIPRNVYSNLRTWGTYVTTASIVPSTTTTAKAESAVVAVQTNVLNETASTQQVTLTTQIVDANGNVVVVAPPVTQSVPAMTPSTFPSSATPMFDQRITVPNPTLWYPNNSIYGKPYLYKVFHVVSVNGVVVDSTQTTLGIRIITWDKSLPYFNGHAMFLWGGSGRYDYPALGSSVPEEQQWRDLELFVAGGGNLWRPGHSSSSEEFVDAADAYGVMIVQPSGDGENGFNTPAPDDVTLKKELHRDMIIRDRSHPSILAWESNNGVTNQAVGTALIAINQVWDPISTRPAADRTPDPVNGLLLGCTLQGCEVGVKNQFPNNPAWGAEYWGNGTARGLAYDHELTFLAPFLNDWRKSKQANAFGMVQWYFADTPGETGLFAEYQQYRGTPQQATYENSVRSIGSSSVDMNRFPKLLYYAYQAAWTPFSLKPVVRLGHHWNRSGQVTVNAFSNCPSVRLRINGGDQGTKTPNPWNSDSNSNLTQSTRLLPFQASWDVTFAAGTLLAECLDQFGSVVATDSKVTAGAAAKVVLKVVPALVRPDGTAFAVTANGSDAAFVVAEVQDANGNVVPTAANLLTFSVSGPATYLGGTQQYVANGSNAYSTSGGRSAVNYHAPGDPELQAEGGLSKIALLSQFTSGTVTVTATSPGLASGSATYTIQPVPSFQPPATAPTIILQPASTAVTSGQSATFTVTATGTAPMTFQWFRNGTAISGATAANYVTPATTSADNNAQFTVRLTNSLGSATSSAASLTVVAPAAVAITTPPASRTAYVGQTATFSVTATGSPTLTYQWRKNGTAIAGATAATYTTPVLTAADNGASYSVVVTNPVNSMTSAAAILTVNPAVAPTLTQQPTSVSVRANDPVSFSVMASGTSPFTYQWQFNGANITGANGSTYTIAQAQNGDAGKYTVVVSNAAGSVTSAAATLTIAPPGTNLALRQPTTGSSTQGGGLEATYATDGDLTTRWASAGAIDPSWLQVDLGTVKALNTVVLYWEAAYATQYQIQYSNDGQAWYLAASNTNGQGGVETVSFPTVQGRYVRMYGQARATTYGYSLYELQVYNVPQCGGAGERFTVLSSALVKDNQSGLTWQRAQTTYADQGAQYTQAIAQAYCASQSMRLPTQAEALGIGGVNSAACAFPLPWSTWSSTADPSDATRAAFVSYTGLSTWQVANNYPGGVVCTSGSTVAAPTITTQPTSKTVAVGQTATFSVAASGSGTLTYQWRKNGATIAGATATSYTTPTTTVADSGAQFTVVVTNAGGGVISNAATLTVTGGSCTTVPSVPGTLSATANSATQLSLAWGASTAGSGCAVTYDVFRATTSGFTPGTTNRIATGLTGTTYQDGTVAASTTYYYVVKAVDAAGSSAGSNQASATTPGNPTGTLLSQGKSATASSAEAGLGAANAVDGNADTRWGSAFTNNEWLYVDLGASATITRVVLNWEPAYATGYQIQTASSASGPWTNIYSTTTGDGGIDDFSVSGTGRYVRMNGSQRALPGYGYSLWEFQVYGTSMSTGTLLSQGKSATASSAQAGLGVANAVDGNAGTRWGSAFTNNEWLYVDLGASATITRVVLNWEPAYATGYQIQTASSASGPWTNIYSTTTGDGGIDDFSVSGTGRYVRMNGTQRALPDYGYSLWEFQVYGSQP